MIFVKNSKCDSESVQYLINMNAWNLLYVTIFLEKRGTSGGVMFAIGCQGRPDEGSGTKSESIYQAQQKGC